MRRLDHDMQYEWHVAINVFNSNKNPADWQSWLYDAKQIADEVPRLAMLFAAERLEQLPEIHQQCSQSTPEPVNDNHLTCCMGVKCKECPFLLALEKAQVTPEQLDEIKAWTCATHIIRESAAHPNSFDTSEGYILTEDDKMFWSNVYESLSSGDEFNEED